MALMFEGLQLPGGADFHVHLRDGAMMETVKLHRKATKLLRRRSNTQRVVGSSDDQAGGH